MDCMRHAIPRKPHIWTPDADARLLEAVNIYGTESWAQGILLIPPVQPKTEPLMRNSSVARQVSEDATSAQCQSRYVRTLDPGIKRGAWSAEEDDLLRNAVNVFGRSWMDVCTWLPGRNNEQCRERWQEAQNSSRRGAWSPEEDQALLDAFQFAEEPRWQNVSKVVGRTETLVSSRVQNL